MIFLEKTFLFQASCYRDVLIRRKDYRLSKLDKEFVTELCNSKRKYL